MCIQRIRLSKSFVRNSMLLTLIFAGATVASTSFAFVRLQTGSNGLFWPNVSTSPISFVINSQTVNGIEQADYQAAVKRSFQSWQEVGDSNIQFAENTDPGQQARTDFQADDIHTVMFDSNNSSGFFGNAGLVAVTPIEFTNGGQITDADILINARDHNFSCDNTPDSFDVQSVVTHEVGHFIGLDHTAVLAATMGPFALKNTTYQRSLGNDDKSATSSVYPAPGNSLTSMFGRVEDDNNNRVAGAHVVIMSEGGQVATSTLTDNSGNFVATGMEANRTYIVFVEPLDGPVIAQNFSTSISGQTIENDFAPTFYGSFNNPQMFTPGMTALDLGTIQVRDPVGPQRMNITNNSKTALAAGQNVLVTLSSSGLIQSDDFFVSHPAINVTNVLVSGSFGTLVTMTLEIPPSVQPGIYNIYAYRSITGDFVSLTGGLEIVNATPMLEVAIPNTAEEMGGEVITISGQNFVDGLKVIIGNTIISNATVISPEEIQFTLPNVPAGTHNLTVENPDGRFARIEDAFTTTTGSGGGNNGGNNGGGNTTPPTNTAPPPAGGGGGGGGGGGCDVAPGLTNSNDALGVLLPFILLLLGLGAMRRHG